MENEENVILRNARSIAIVGASSKPERPSYRVAKYLKEKGYKIFPVNPGEKEILGEPCYPDLKSILQPVDVVDIFRRSEDVLPIIDFSIEIGAKAVWMQEGVRNDEAAEKARKAGLRVVMDRCIMKAHKDLIRTVTCFDALDAFY
ncbi:MAG: CoA-binding protein [Dehalococcoidia bacterium]|nr:CoA-binding protein [Dehalococcoidia bacterium]